MSRGGRVGFALKRGLARIAGRLSRLSGRGGGTTLPGRLLLRTAPDAIDRLADGLTGGAVVISATNGKTTTAGMISGALEAAGRDPVHNKAGSNMAWGVATALLEQDGTEGLFEVDEAWLGEVCDQLPVRSLVLGNLFRDQLDRYGELERLADEWAAIAERLGPETALVLNADDPLIADLGRTAAGEPRPNATYFGIEDPSAALDELQHAHDAKHCRRCGAPYVYERAFVGHLGHYSCPECGLTRPAPQLAATDIRPQGMDGTSFTLRTPEGEYEAELPLPGLYNVYNALGALSAARAAGVATETALAALGRTAAVFGRVEMLEIGGSEVALLLVKNPAGANGVLRTIREESAGVDPDLRLWVALNDRIADGRDISWVWDADFELLAGRVASVTCSGTRAAELALRLDYAGIERSRITVDHDLVGSFDRAAEAAAARGDGPESSRLFALPTYTALIDLRTALAKRGEAEEYWR